MKTYRLVQATTLALAVVVSSGCSVALRHEPLGSPTQLRSEQLAVSRRAEGIDGKVGWGRFTVFYIPLIPVYITGKDGNEQVMDFVRDGLRRAGYRITTTEGPTHLSLPVLTCKIEKFWYNNYTWLFPFVPTWGNTHINLALTTNDGRTLWARAFKGSGFTLNFTDGYSIAANESMEEILNEMVREFSSQDFQLALRQ